MMRKKILFWIVWVLAAPLVFLYYGLRFRGFAQISYWRSGLPGTKTALVRQAVYERLVTEKPIQRHLYNLYRRRR